MVELALNLKRALFFGLSKLKVDCLHPALNVEVIKWADPEQAEYISSKIIYGNQAYLWRWVSKWSGISVTA